MPDPDEQEARAVELIRATLGGTLTNPRTFARATHCPVCGRSTEAGNRPGPVLCLPCTEGEVGEYADELTARVSRKMTRLQYLALPRDSDGRPILPSLGNRAWRKLTGRG